MTPNHSLTLLSPRLPLRATNGGLCISHGVGQHPDRILSSHELIYVTRGVLSLREEEQAFTAYAGETLLLWPDRRHYSITPYPPDLSFYWLHFHLLDQDGASSQDMHIPQHIKVRRPDHLTSLFRRFLDDQETVSPIRFQQLPASLIVMLMLCEIMDSDVVDESLESATAILADRANTIIRTRFYEPLSTSMIATQLNCNPDYLGRVFHLVHGCTLTQAIHQRRIKYARKLLIETSKSTEEVAYSCGFRDTTYFRRLFKRSEGMAPRKFRLLYSKLHINTD